jgi:hypothetical protein
MSNQVLFLDEMQNYLEDLCEKHVDIRHKENDQRCFARLETDAHITDITQNGGTAIVVVANVSGQRIGALDDQQIRQELTLLFAVRGFGDDMQSQASNALKKAETIMMDFVARMDMDFLEGCNVLQYLEPEKVSWDKFDGPWLDNFYGWEFTMPFKSYMRAYNPAKWME